MKKYNVLIFLSILIYILITLFSFITFYNFQNRKAQDYKVEINRIMSSLNEEVKLEDIDINNYKYIEKINYLDANIINKDTIDNFFNEYKDNISIRPLYSNENLIGYVKFIYKNDYNSQLFFLIVLEASLLILELTILIILYYIKHSVIKPFHILSEIPLELAKGRLKGEVKVEKSKYFKKFLWGISQLKDELEVSKKRQLQLMKEKKSMLLSLSHDIKTPLNIIRLYNKALEEEIYENKEDKKKALHQIEEKIIEIEKYVEEITKSTREDLMDLPVEQGEFYLNELVNKIIEVYKEKCFIRNINFNILEYKNKLLIGDINRSQEVLENLLENAIKYGDGKLIEITFSEEDYCQLIHIFSSGITVSENEINHLFDSFFRGSNSKGKEGSGLGLFICRELMHKMKGDIYAENKEGGMCFTIVFKL